MVNLTTEFGVSRFIHYEDTKGNAKCRNWDGFGRLGATKGHRRHNNWAEAMKCALLESRHFPLTPTVRLKNVPPWLCRSANPAMLRFLPRDALLAPPLARKWTSRGRPTDPAGLWVLPPEAETFQQGIARQNDIPADDSSTGGISMMRPPGECF